MAFATLKTTTKVRKGELLKLLIVGVEKATVIFPFKKQGKKLKIVRILITKVRKTKILSWLGD